MTELSEQDLDRIVADVRARGGVSAYKLLRSRSEEQQQRVTEALAQRGIERTAKHFRLDPVEQIARLVQREGLVKINRDTLVGVADAAEKNQHVRRAIAEGVIVEVNARPPFVKKGARGPFYAAPLDAVMRSDLDPFFARFAALREELAPFKRSRKLPAYRANLMALREALAEADRALADSLGGTVLEATEEEVDAAFNVALVEPLLTEAAVPTDLAAVEASAVDDLAPAQEAAPVEGAAPVEEAESAEEAGPADASPEDAEAPVIEVAGYDPRIAETAPSVEDDAPIIEVSEDDARWAPAAPAKAHVDLEDHPLIEVAGDDASEGGATPAEDARPPVAANGSAISDLAERLLAFVREQHDHGMLVVSTAELVRSFASEAAPSAVHAALLHADAQGEVELRAETDLTALTAEEARRCPRREDGTALTYVRSLR